MHFLSVSKTGKVAVSATLHAMSFTCKKTKQAMLKDTEGKKPCCLPRWIRQHTHIYIFPLSTCYKDFTPVSRMHNCFLRHTICSSSVDDHLKINQFGLLFWLLFGHVDIIVIVAGYTLLVRWRGPWKLFEWLLTLHILFSCKCPDYNFAQ